MKLLSRARLCNPMDGSPPGSSVHRIFQREYWSGLPFPSPGDLPDPWIKLSSPTLQADALTSEPPGKPIYVYICAYICIVLVTQLCPFLCNPVDCSCQAPLSIVILQARRLEWIAIPFSRGSSPSRDQTHISCIVGRFFTTEPSGKHFKCTLSG